MNAVVLIVRHLKLTSFEFRTGSLQVFSSPKDRQTNLNIFSYQSTPAHRHTGKNFRRRKAMADFRLIRAQDGGTSIIWY